MMYFAIHWTMIIWVEIKTLQVRQQAKKAPDAWSQHETTQKNKQETLINLKYFILLLWWLVCWFLSCRSQKVVPTLFSTIWTNFHTLSKAIFYTGPVCFYQILQAMPVKPRPLRGSVRNIRTPQRFLAMIILSFRLLWNDVKPKRVYCKLMLKSVRLCPCLPRSRFFDVTQRSFGGALRDIQKTGCEGDYLCSPLWKMFDHWVDVWINTSAPSHWLNSVAWPVGHVLKFRDIPDCS